tara:strand:- start:768 stop:1064 length:297 start_codon:yes stop_codon:yes gene_type:complete
LFYFPKIIGTGKYSEETPRKQKGKTLPRVIFIKSSTNKTKVQFHFHYRRQLFSKQVLLEKQLEEMIQDTVRAFEEKIAMKEHYLDEKRKNGLYATSQV